MGGVVATSVFFFDVSIQYVHDLPDIMAQVSGGGGGRERGACGCEVQGKAGVKVQMLG